MNIVVFLKKAQSITETCLLIAGIFSFGACGDSESSSNPSGPENQSGTTINSYPISVNQEEHEFTMDFHLDMEKCILQNGNLGWDTTRYLFKTVFSYNLSEGMLFLENEELHSSPFWGPENQDIFGEWRRLGDDNTPDEYVKAIFTHDSLIFKQIKPRHEDAIISEPVETPITLRTSYFMFDLYRCITEEHFCVFDQWHFSKPQGPNAEDMTSHYRTTILEETSNSMRIINNNREIFVNVLHVQDDSLNNGNGYYSAYITHQQDTCFFDFFKGPVTRELCKEENLPYFIGYELGDDDDENEDYVEQEAHAVLDYMVKSNKNEFAQCVDLMINKP